MDTVLTEDTLKDSRWTEIISPTDLTLLLQTLRSCLTGDAQVCPIPEQGTADEAGSPAAPPALDAEAACPARALRLAMLVKKESDYF